MSVRFLTVCKRVFLLLQVFEKIERDMIPIMALRSRFSLKTIADATMTTTRLAVFITDEVTGPT